MSDAHKTIEVFPGLPLCTKRSHRYSNGVVFQVGEDITVLTDFGNLVYFNTPTELFNYYYVSDYNLEHLMFSGKFDDVEVRIDQQIALLKRAKERLHGERGDYVVLMNKSKLTHCLYNHETRQVQCTQTGWKGILYTHPEIYVDIGLGEKVRYAHYAFTHHPTYEEYLNRD